MPKSRSRGPQPKLSDAWPALYPSFVGSKSRPTLGFGDRQYRLPKLAARRRHQSAHAISRLVDLFSHNRAATISLRIDAISRSRAARHALLLSVFSNLAFSASANLIATDNASCRPSAYVIVTSPQIEKAKRCWLVEFACRGGRLSENCSTFAHLRHWYVLIVVPAKTSMQAGQEYSPHFEQFGLAPPLSRNASQIRSPWYEPMRASGTGSSGFPDQS
jgi:hypothetical protein